ncbi:MAG: alpha/beta fold hydrolase [Candidatus Neomarinimicrobiota bacterium]
MRYLRYFLLILCGYVSAQEPRQIGNLITENIPEIPTAIVERNSQYRNVRAASFKSWDPAGDGMLISTRFGETDQLHYVGQALGSRRQITFYEEPVGGGSFNPNPANRGFLFSKDRGGNEYYQIYYFDLETATARLLTDGESRNGLGPWAAQGDRFAYSSNQANGTDMQIYIGHIDGRAPQLVVSEAGYWDATSWSPDGTRLLVMKYVSINETYVYLVDLQSLEMTPFNPSEKKIAYDNAIFSRDGQGIYYTSDEDTEFRHLRYYDLASSRSRLISGQIPWDVGGFTQSDDGNLLAYLTNEDGISKIYLVRTKDYRELPVPDLPVGDIYSLRFRHDNRQLALTIDNAQTPGDVFVLDTKKQKLVRWTASEVGGLDPARFAVPELVRVASFDGLSVPAFLYRPSTPGPHPVVIYIHGGPESQYTPYFSSALQYWINELGIAVLATNVRGSEGYGKTYLQLDNAFNRENSVKDIGAFLDWIATRPDLDQERVAVFGGSYGGYMVLSSMTHYNDRIRAGVDIVGISNFITVLQNTKDYRRDLRRAEYGDERDPQMRAYFEKIAPSNNAHKITRPLFIVQGHNDPRVPVSEAEQMRDVIRANGGEVWYLVALDEGHGFKKKSNRDYYYNAVSLFWEKYLLK